jgi:thiamine monophosphate synthase
LVQAGAAGVAVMREVMSAHDPAAALRSLLSALDAAGARAQQPAGPGTDI